jgi:spore coat protein A, manganese oxidase
LKLGAMAGAGLALPLGTLSIPLSRLAASSSIRSPSVEPFKVPLSIPPTLKPVRTGTDTDYYEMVQRAGRQEILPGLKTEVWGYDSIFPGPTVEVRSGRDVVIRQWNELPVPVATHLHGGKTPPESDGYPTDLILPEGHGQGSSAHMGHGSVGGHSHFFKDYRYPNDQRAATLWYHDHRMDFTGPQVYRG